MDEPAERRRKANERVSAAEIVQIIAERVRLPGEKPGEARKKVRNRLRYAEEVGEFAKLRIPPKAADGTYALGDVMGWAKRNWPGKLAGLPASHYGDIDERPALGDEASGDAIPADLDRCKAALVEALLSGRLLEKELANERALIAQLRPEAQKQKALIERNRASATLPRNRRR